MKGRPSTALALGAALACTLTLAACGSSTPSSTGADPATVVPATAKLYVSFLPKPEGSLKAAANSDLRALTHTSQPFATLFTELTSASGIGKLSYSREVSPWLGEKAGLFSSSLTPIASLSEGALSRLAAGGSPEAALKAAASAPAPAKSLQAALVLDTTSTSKAESFLSTLAAREGAHAATYEGTRYETGRNGLTDAIVGSFAVIGTESAVKEVIATHKGGASLSKSSEGYHKLSAKAPSQALLNAYLDTSGQAAPPGSAASLLSVLAGGAHEVGLSLVPGNGSVSVDLDALNGSSEAANESAARSAAGLLASLPEGSWLAAAVPDVGTHLPAYIGALGDVGSVAGSAMSSFGGPALQRLLNRLAAHHAALQSVFSGWAGSGAVFASGSGLLELEGGIVIESKEQARSVGAVSELGAALASAGATVTGTKIPGAQSAITITIPRFPLTLAAGAGSGRFVIGLGTGSVAAGISGQAPLSGSPLYKAAESALSGNAKPSLVFDVPSFTALLEGVGLGESASLREVMPYLRSVSMVSAGEQSLGGGITRMQLVVGLQRQG